MEKQSNFLKSVFFRDRLILVSLLAAFLINIILWIWLAIKFGYSQERIPLHFNLISGIDYLGSARQIYQIPFLGLVTIVVNLLLAKIIYEREKLFSYFLVTAAAAVELILFAVVLALVRLIF